MIRLCFLSRLSLSLHGLHRLPAGIPRTNGAALPGLTAGGVSAAMALRLCLAARVTAGLAGTFVCRVFPLPVMTAKLTAPGIAMEAKGQHPSGASEALLRALLSIPHRSPPLRAASSSPESLRALASPLMPLNPPAKRNPTDRQCPAGIELAVHWQGVGKPADHSGRLRMQIAKPQLIFVARAAKFPLEQFRRRSRMRVWPAATLRRPESSTALSSCRISVP